MTRQQLIRKMRDILLKRRNALRRSLAGQLSLLGRRRELQPVGDPCDEAQGSVDDEIFTHLAQAESEELRLIEDALERMRDGTYGICEHCDAPIPHLRLQALPYAMMCIRCQRERERITEPHRFGHYTPVFGGWLRGESRQPT